MIEMIVIDPLVFALAITAAVCWGAAQVLGKIAMREMSPLVFNTIRFTFMAALMGPIALLSGNMGGYSPVLVLIAVVSGGLGSFVGVHLFFSGVYAPEITPIPSRVIKIVLMGT